MADRSFTTARPRNLIFYVFEFSQQYRLLPHLATAYVMKAFTHWLAEQQFKAMVDSFLKVDADNAAAVGVEIHGVSSAVKPVCTWMARDAIQDCRESCGGHGYLKGESTKRTIVL